METKEEDKPNSMWVGLHVHDPPWCLLVLCTLFLPHRTSTTIIKEGVVQCSYFLASSVSGLEAPWYLGQSLTYSLLDSPVALTELGA